MEGGRGKEKGREKWGSGICPRLLALNNKGKIQASS